MKWSTVSCAVCTIGLCSVQLSTAQSDPTASENSSAPYEDILIDQGALPPLDLESERDPYNFSGWPRTLRIEAYTSYFDRDTATTRENGLSAEGHIDTPAYGTLSVSATLRQPLSNSLVSIWQRGMPFDGGWQANNGLGMLNTLSIDLSRNQYRFFLPTFPVAGAVSEWMHRDKFQFQISGGEPGLYNGLRVAGFERLGGQLVTLGSQAELNQNWFAGVQLIDARNVRNSIDGNSPNDEVSAHAWYAATAWQGKNSRIQTNFLGSGVGDGKAPYGIWIDGAARQGRFRHNYGLFRLEPNLVWGYTPVASDIIGGYYHLNYQSQQWRWDAGLDSVDSISGNGTSGLFATGNIRYQWDRSLGVGMGSSVRDSSNRGWSAFVFADKQNRLGSTRIELTKAAEQGTHHGTQVTLDQTWPTPVGMSFSTSLSQSKETDSGAVTNRTSVALSGASDLFNTVSLDGNIRWTRARSNTNSTGLSANVALNWRITSRWTWVTTYYENRANEQTFFTLDPLIPSRPTSTVEKNRALFVVLRYEERAGTAIAPLGGTPGSGAGSIVGYLYLDSNDDGRRDAREEGAANVTIVLNERFSTRTDANGRFEFSLVAAGKHFLTVIPDNLPLPWSVANDGKVEVVVRTRESAILNIPATKLR